MEKKESFNEEQFTHTAIAAGNALPMQEASSTARNGIFCTAGILFVDDEGLSVLNLCCIHVGQFLTKNALVGKNGLETILNGSEASIWAKQQLSLVVQGAKHG